MQEPMKTSAMTLPQEQKKWQQLNESLSQEHQPKRTVLHEGDGYSIQRLDHANDVNRVGKFMRNCWQGLGNDPEVHERNGYSYHSLHDEHGLPRGAFYVKTNPHSATQFPDVQQPLGMRNELMHPEHGHQLAEWADLHGATISGRDAQEWADGNADDWEDRREIKPDFQGQIGEPRAARVAGRSQVEWARLQGKLEDKYGPSQSSVVHEHPEGWTVQQHHRPEDVQRVGEMMANCWQDSKRAQAGPYFTLHDPNGKPKLAVDEQGGELSIPLGEFNSWAVGGYGGRPQTKRLKMLAEPLQALGYDSWNGYANAASASPWKSTLGFEPTAKTSAQTRTQLLQQAQAHERQHGPDLSEPVHTFADGWTVKALTTFGDMHREGQLMSNCFSPVDGYDQSKQFAHDEWQDYPGTEHSEYDEERLSDDLPEYDIDKAKLQEPIGSNLYSLRDPDNVPHASIDPHEGSWYGSALGKHNSPPKPEHLQRLVDWTNTGSDVDPEVQQYARGWQQSAERGLAQQQAMSSANLSDQAQSDTTNLTENNWPLLYTRGERVIEGDIAEDVRNASWAFSTSRASGDAWTFSQYSNEVKTMYHVAPSEARGSIERQGLTVSEQRADNEAGTYLWDSQEAADDYRGDKDAPHDIWQVDVQGLKTRPDQLWGQYGAHVVNQPVESQKMRRVASAQGWDQYRHLESIVQRGREQTMKDTPGQESEAFGCHYIAPEVARAIGGAHESGIKLTGDPSEPYFDHHWAIAPEGHIVDATHRKVVSQHDPEYKSYVPYSELGEGADPEENPKGFSQWLDARTAHRENVPLSVPYQAPSADPPAPAHRVSVFQRIAEELNPLTVSGTPSEGSRLIYDRGTASIHLAHPNSDILKHIAHKGHTLVGPTCHGHIAQGTVQWYDTPEDAPRVESALARHTGLAVDSTPSPSTVSLASVLPSTSDRLARQQDYTGNGPKSEDMTNEALWEGNDRDPTSRQTLTLNSDSARKNVCESSEADAGQRQVFSAEKISRNSWEWSSKTSAGKIMFHAGPAGLDQTGIKSQVPQFGQGQQAGVYLFVSSGTAARYMPYDGGMMSLKTYEVDVNGLDLVKDPQMRGAYFVAHDIEPERVRDMFAPRASSAPPRYGASGHAHHNPWTGLPCSCHWGHPKHRTASQKTAAGLQMRKLLKAPDKKYKTPEGQAFLEDLQKIPEDQDSILPYVAQRWKKGDIAHTPGSLHYDAHPGGGNTQSVWKEDAGYRHQIDRWHQYFEARQHPLRQGVNVMDPDFDVIQMHAKVNEHQKALQEKQQKERYFSIFGRVDPEQVVHRFGPEAGPHKGWHVVKLDGHQAEGDSHALGHCIGSDDQPYRHNIEAGTIDAYSLRDASGYPKVSWHNNPSGNGIGHMQGRSGYPKEEHRNLITHFNSAHELPDHEPHEEELEGQYDLAADVDGPTTMADFISHYRDGEYGWEQAEHEGHNVGPETEIYVRDPDWASIADEYLNSGNGREREAFEGALDRHHRSDMAEHLGDAADHEDTDHRQIISWWNSEVARGGNDSVDLPAQQVSEVDAFNEAHHEGQEPEISHWGDLANDYLNHGSHYDGRHYDGRSEYEQFHDNFQDPDLLHPELVKHFDPNDMNHQTAANAWNSVSGHENMQLGQTPEASPAPAPANPVPQTFSKTYDENWTLSSWSSSQTEWTPYTMPKGQTLHVSDDGQHIRDEDGEENNLDDWLHRTNPSHYVDPADPHEEFWQNPQVVFHGTSEEHIPSIMQEGLRTENKTRGIQNKSIGGAVFTTPHAGVASYHYGPTLAINAPQMKADGYTPVVGTDGFDDDNHRAQLAHLLDVDDHHVEQGMGGEDPDTVVFHEPIPAKYITRMSDDDLHHMSRASSKSSKTSAGKIGPALYHVAPTDQRTRIRQHGLQAADPFHNERWDLGEDNNRRVFPKGVYAWSNPDSASDYAHRLEGEHDIWKVPASEIQSVHLDPARVFSEAQYIPHSIENPELHEGPEHRALSKTASTYDEGHPLHEIAQRHPNVDLFATQHPGGVRVKMMQVAPEAQGQGYASAALRDVLDYADSQRLPVALTPGIPENRKGLSQTALKSWYRSQGFVPNKGHNKDYAFTDSMIRPTSSWRLFPGGPSESDLLPYAGDLFCYDQSEAVEQSWPQLKAVEGFYGTGHHAWNEAPDGTIVDVTHAQFDPEHEINIVPPGTSHPYRKTNEDR